MKLISNVQGRGPVCLGVVDLLTSYPESLNPSVSRAVMNIIEWLFQGSFVFPLTLSLRMTPVPIGPYWCPSVSVPVTVPVPDSHQNWLHGISGPIRFKNVN